MDIVYRREDYFSQSEFLYDLCKSSNDNRELLTSLIVIDVVTSLEVYVERLLKEYIRKYNSFGLRSSLIDERLKIEHSRKVLEHLSKIIVHEHKQNECLRSLEEIGSMWSRDLVVPLELTIKFPKGKHGEVQLVKLFKRIGIDDVFDSINIESNSSSLIQDDMLDIQEFIQEITAKRNLAIHEGAPLHSHLSLENVRDYIDITDRILGELTAAVNNKLRQSIPILEEGQL